MITLSADCLLFRLANGERVPFSPDLFSADVEACRGHWFDPEVVGQAAEAVYHFFRHDQGRQTVSVGEFAEALEKALGAFAPVVPAPAAPAGRVVERDLLRLALECGDHGELFFFQRLREELRAGLCPGTEVLRFRGLRPCVKQLAGTRRWTGRCRSLSEHIVGFLRQCLGVDRRTDVVAIWIQ